MLLVNLFSKIFLKKYGEEKDMLEKPILLLFG